MGYQVLIENLEAAAKSLRTTVKGMGDYDFGETNVSGASFGHVELAAWFDAVAEQCDNAGQALHDGAEQLAASLDASARRYRDGDLAVADILAGYTKYGPPAVTPPHLFQPFPILPTGDQP